MSAAAHLPEGPGPDPKLDRFRRVGAGLRLALALTVVAAAATVVLSGDAERWAGRTTLVVLVATPLLRVGWLAQRWLRRGDPRFAAVAVGVLGVVASGALLGWLLA